MSEQTGSGYLEHLPAVLHTEFLGKFLLAFEDVFSGRPTAALAGTQPAELRRPGLAETIGNLVNFLDPATVGDERFLPWLARWVGLSLREDWTPEMKIEFIQHAVRLYGKRGTPDGMREVLEIFLRNEPALRGAVRVHDEFAGIPHYFQVRLDLTDPRHLRRVQQTARAVIDIEKPAHTFYALRFVFDSVRLESEVVDHGDRLVLGETTVVGASWLGARTERARRAGLVLGENTWLGSVPEPSHPDPNGGIA